MYRKPRQEDFPFMQTNACLHELLREVFLISFAAQLAFGAVNCFVQPMSTLIMLANFGTGHLPGSHYMLLAMLQGVALERHSQSL
jgi:hypothetical protein